MTDERPEEPEGAETPTEPVAIEDLTTQAVQFEDLRTEAVPMAELLDPPPPADVDAPTELIVAPEVDAPAGHSTLDTVFGDGAFVEHDDAFLLSPRRGEPPSGRRAARAPDIGAAAPAAPGDDRSGGVAGVAGVADAAKAAAVASDRDPLPRSQRILIGVAVGLGVLVAMIAAFIIGQRLPGLVGVGPVGASGPAISASSPASPGASSRPEPSSTEALDPATGALAPGVYDWDALVGGECLEPYIDPWQEEFTVADCAAPHAAQLVAVGALPGEGASAYPGEEALAGQVSALCQAPGVIDLAPASAYRDLQVAGFYPVSAEGWSSGERRYGCLVSRSSGEPITGSLALPLG